MKVAICRITALIGLAMLLASCRALFGSPSPLAGDDGQSLTCSDIVEKELLRFPMAQLKLEEGMQWVRDNYSVDPSVEDYRYRSDYYQYMLRWQRADREYSMGFKQGTSDGITVRWQRNSPTIQEILHCVGEPTYYRASYEQFPEALYTSLWLLYPEQGLTFYHSSPKRLKAFIGTTPMQLVDYVKPGQLEEMIARLLVGEPDAVTSDNMKELFKPWPGGVEQIMIENTKY